MPGFLLGLSALSLFIWFYLAFFRGGFWRANQRLLETIKLDRWPSVVAIIPARNEAETIGVTVNSLLEQNYKGSLQIIVIDDNSDDGTADAAGNHPNLKVIKGKPLEQGWTGKLWAVSQGIDHIAEIAPKAEYVLMTDADIEHHKNNLEQLVSKAEKSQARLVSLMVALRCQSFWEKLLIPAFVYFFQKLYPFGWVNRANNKMAAAAGGCMLIHLPTLREAGGVEEIRGRIIDDCAMGALIKSKAPIWLGLSSETKSLRAYTKLSEIWQMVARTAFVQLNHSLIALIGTVLAMFIIYLVPPILFFYGIFVSDPILWMIAGGAYLTMAQLYAPTLARYRRSFLWAFLLPLAGFLYTLMTVSSAIKHWQGRGGAWKGRSYSKTHLEG